MAVTEYNIDDSETFCFREQPKVFVTMDLDETINRDVDDNIIVADDNEEWIINIHVVVDADYNIKSYWRVSQNDSNVVMSYLCDSYEEAKAKVLDLQKLSVK